MSIKQYTTLIVGSGFGGQCAAINLLERGHTDFRILERRPFMGGTWTQNSYPGAAVDVQSPLYSLSFEPYPWTQMYAEQHELERYTEHIIEKHGLAKKTDVGTTVKSVRWLEPEQRWEVETVESGTYRARFVINASGPLSTPVFPTIKGRERFAGASFHTNDWNHSVDYRGKRVAIVGTGASAAQVIPAIAGSVSQLHVFQRSPHWVLPRPDHVFTPAERAVLRNPLAYKALRAAIYASLELRVVGMKYSLRALELTAQREALAHLRAQVADPVLRAQLTPDFTIGCKRVILSSTLYPALCLPTTTLHTGERGIAEIDERGILTTDGERVDVDIIVYATGYDATDGVISYPVVGRDGHSVAELWSEYPRAYLGTSLPHLPNLFLVTGPNTGIGHTSALFIIESQMNYIMSCITTALDKGYRTVEVTPRAEAEYTAMIHREMEGTVWQAGGCNSWYKSKSGKVIAMFPGFSFTFRHLARRMDPRHHRLVA